MLDGRQPCQQQQGLMRMYLSLPTLCLFLSHLLLQLQLQLQLQSNLCLFVLLGSPLSSATMYSSPLSRALPIRPSLQDLENRQWPLLPKSAATPGIKQYTSSICKQNANCSNCYRNTISTLPAISNNNTILDARNNKMTMMFATAHRT